MDPELREETQAFIMENQLEDKAVEALWNISPVLLKAVIGLGDLRGCKNRTAGCLGRIKNLQQKEGELEFLAQRGQQKIDKGAVMEEVEQFLTNNRIQERAAKRLRDAGPMVQRQVMDQGPVKGRNIDAVLVSRINDIQSGKSFEVNPVKWAAPSGSATHQLQNSQQSHSLISSEEVDAFISENNIEPGAANVLRCSEPMVQRTVIDIGPLKGRNVNAILVGRIKEAVQKQQDYGQPAISMGQIGGSSSANLRQQFPALQRSNVDMRNPFHSSSQATDDGSYDLPAEFSFNSGIAPMRRPGGSPPAMGGMPPGFVAVRSPGLMGARPPGLMGGGLPGFMGGGSPGLMGGASAGIDGLAEEDLPEPQQPGEKLPQPPGEKRRRVSGWDARTPPPGYGAADPWDPSTWS